MYHMLRIAGELGRPGKRSWNVMELFKVSQAQPGKIVKAGEGAWAGMERKLHHQFYSKYKTFARYVVAIE